MCESYFSPKTRIKVSPIEGRGLFAIKPIKKGEVVAIKGGHILDEKTLREIEDEIEESYIQIENNFYIGPMNKAEIPGNKLFINHSCDPNIGIRGQITFVAMHNIRAGEELTQDWAMTDAEPGQVKCNCRSKKCRRSITGDDWKLPELQKRYSGYFSSYIEENIKKIKQ